MPSCSLLCYPRIKGKGGDLMDEVDIFFKKMEERLVRSENFFESIGILLITLVVTLVIIFMVTFAERKRREVI